MKNKIFFWVMIFGFLLINLSACGGSSSESASEESGGAGVATEDCSNHGKILGSFYPTGSSILVNVYSNGCVDYNSKYPEVYNCGSGTYDVTTRTCINGTFTGLEWECVEFVNRYYLSVYGKDIASPRANATDYYTTASERGLKAYPNDGTSVPPQIGDILVSKGDGTEKTENGHVGIVGEVEDDHIGVVHQNWNNSDETKALNYRITRKGNSLEPFGNGYPIIGWLRVPAAVGWSDVTGYRHAETTKQMAIIAAALNGGNRPSPQSITGNTGSRWLTDISDNDGARMRDTIKDVYNYWIGSGSPSLPLPSIPTATQNTMRTHLTQTYPPSSYQGYTNTSDQNAFIDHIRSVFNGTVPTTDNETLAYLGIRAQCKEFADHMVEAGGGTQHSYGISAAVASMNIRPGMYAFKYGNGHAAIIVAVYWDASGQPTQLRLAESNWGTGWNNPLGQVPWSRTVATGRVVPISDYYVVSTE